MVLTFIFHMVKVSAQTTHHGGKMEYLLALDRKVFLWINNQWSIPPLDFLFAYIITWLGNGGVVIALVIIFFIIKGWPYVRQYLPWFLAAMLLAGLCILALKKMIPRPRPLSEFAPLIEAGKVQVNVLGRHLWYRSFPSGDTQTAFTAATYLSFLLPRWTPLFLSLAVGVGLSRIYMGAHFPLDVIVGALIGAAFAAGAWWMRKRVLNPSNTPEA
jgi:undecaprenyl-diphosphatase